MHWARRYVGKQWAADGDGPVRFSCWNLTRAAAKLRMGIELPPLAEADGPAPVVRAARDAGLCPVAGVALADDIVLMRGHGRLHTGYVIEDRGRVKVLHSAHERGVACDLWADATEGMQVELWRRAA